MGSHAHEYLLLLVTVFEFAGDLETLGHLVHNCATVRTPHTEEGRAGHTPPMFCMIAKFSSTSARFPNSAACRTVNDKLAWRVAVTHSGRG